jgi:hypothetical protein
LENIIYGETLMNSNLPKIYFGPMTKNIVDVLLKYSIKHDAPIGFIPSRRQVEHDGGYVNDWKTTDFYKYVKGQNTKALVCRDHGGRKQGKQPDDGQISFREDAKTGFDIIHIDPWKSFSSLDEVVDATCNDIESCLSINPNLRFEIGTEEAIHPYTPEELDYFLYKTKNQLGDKFEKVLYAVVQFGTAIVGTKNVGVFNRQRSKQMIDVCKKHNVLSKEHNGDYLTKAEIEDRFSIGLDAINIAPEFGVLETSTVIEHMLDNMDFENLDKFFQVCYGSRKWVKWIPAEVASLKSSLVSLFIARVCGHYVMSNPFVLDYKKKNPKLDNLIQEKLRVKISDIMSLCGNE